MTTNQTEQVEKFDEDYFLRGPDCHKSNFADYRWLPDQTISWAQHFRRYMGLKEGDTVLDCGAARGYYVKALRRLGIDAYGYDVSQWAVANCDPAMVPFMSNHLDSHRHYDVVFSKDTMEHVPPDALAPLLGRLLACAKRRLFLIVPLAEFAGGPYIHPKEEKDSTHVNRWTLHDWITFVQDRSTSFVVTGGYQYPGLKPGAYEVANGYGFITAERI